MKDSALLNSLDIDDEDDVVEVPPTLMAFLEKGGLVGDVSNIVPPIVAVNAKGNYIIRGKRVQDPETLAQMNIPDYESCVEVPRPVMAGLLVGR